MGVCPGDNTNWKDSEFWYAEVFDVFSKFDDGESKFALLNHKFVIGKDRFKGEILREFILEWEENLVDDFQEDAVANNDDNNALLKLSDRLQNLTYSFDFKLSEKTKKFSKI